MANRYMGIWEEGVMAVVTRVITFVKTHTIVHLKFTKTLQQCRIGICLTFHPQEPIAADYTHSARRILFFAIFVSHCHGQKILESLEMSFLRWVLWHFHRRGRHCLPAQPIRSIEVLHATFGRERGGQLGNSPFSRLPG